MPRRPHIGLIFLLAASGLIAVSTTVTIPSVSGPLVVDGSLDDAAWRSARSLTLVFSEFGEPFPNGGEIRVATRGEYLCLSARIPEPDRVVAHSTGRNPNWWSEDLVIWTFRVHAAALRRNMTLSLSVNPLGAYRWQNDATLEPLEGAESLLVRAQLGRGEWTVEAAIPLERLAQIGFVEVRRVRAPRPDVPELKWYWPRPNERGTFQLAPLTREPAPEFHPPQPPAPAEPAAQKTHELDWIPRDVWTEEQRKRLGVSRMLENSLRARISAIAEQEKREWQKVDSREAWERFRDPRLAALRKWIGPFPERTPLHAAVTKRVNYGNGFVIENLIYESRPHLVVAANLYLPENAAGRIPAVVVVHSHHAPKTQSELQDLGMTWARSGTAVLVMDQLCAGERSQSQPWYRESYYGRYALGNQLYLAGESLMKWMVWDLMRGIDLLTERPYIDPKRIIMLGAVAGGGDPAAVTAALDPRVAAVIPFNFGEAGPEEHYTEGPRGYDFDTAWPGWGEWETTRNLPSSIADQFFPWFLCVSAAPRPFLYSFEIGWPEDVEHEPAWARYKKVFDLYGARDHLDEVHGFGPFPGPGECTNVGALLRTRIYPILKRWLGVPVPDGEYHNPRPDSDLMCLTPAIAAERRPRSASALALDLARERLAAARSSKAPLKARLAERLGDIEPRGNPAVQALWSKPGAQATVEALTIETEPGITLPVLLLKPANPAVMRAPAVLGVAQDGKSHFLSERAEDVLILLKNGIAVCLPDVEGTGEVSATQSRGPGAMALAATDLMLGRTTIGAQLRDVRTVFRYLASRPDIDPAHIALWADSFAPTNSDDFAFDQSEMQERGPFIQRQAEPAGSLLALLTGLYEDRVTAVAARGGLVSFLSVLEDRFSHVPQDVIVPGILDAGDISDVVQALGPRAVLLEQCVDGRNKVARDARLRSEFAVSLRASSALVVREASGEPSMSQWLVSRCLRKGR